MLTPTWSSWMAAIAPMLSRQLAQYPASRIVMMGPEPECRLPAAALRRTAVDWLARADIAERSSAEMRLALGGSHGPYPTPVA